MNSTFQRTLKAVFPRKHFVWLFLFSLAVAALFWAYTVSEEKSLKDLEIPIDLTGIPQGMMVVGDNLARMATVEFKGSPEVLKRVRQEDVDIRVDLSKLSPGPQLIEITSEDVRLPSSVEFSKAYPKVLHFSLEKVLKKEVPLKPVFIGKPAPGRRVSRWSISPPTTVIEGPESLLYMIHNAPTQGVPLDGRGEDFQIPVTPVFEETAISVQDMGPFILSVFMGEKRAQRTVGPVPIRALHAGFPTTLTPPSLKVRVDGPSSIVSRLTPEDFIAEVDVIKLAPSETSYKLRPVVRPSNKALRGKVDITSLSQRFVAVKIDEKGGMPAVLEVSP